DSLFGGSDKPKSGGGGEKKKTGPYIPDAPGAGADVKESLGQGDIMQVVLQNKPKIADCVQQQKAKQPGSGGKLVMKWTVLTSGKVTNVQAATEELKGAPIASCLTGVIKGMSFPKHKVQGEPISFPFTF